MRNLALSPLEMIYHQRNLILRDSVAGSGALLGRVGGVFEHEYEMGVLPDGATFLDEGCHHRIYSIGGIINPTTGENLHLALRLRKVIDFPPVCFYRDGGVDLEFVGLTPQLADLESFMKQFGQVYAPPYFAMLVTVPLVWRNAVREFAGILTEDVSYGGKLKLEQMGDGFYHRRRNPDGTVDIFYLDPIDAHFPESRQRGVLFWESRLRLGIGGRIRVASEIGVS